MTHARSGWSTAALRTLMAAVLPLWSACTPALDWREVRPEGSAARAMFPCRPASQARTLNLAGAAVEMTVFACIAADTTFALSFADMKDPSLVAPALAELGRAARSHLRTTAPASSQPLAVLGMTPNSQAGLWQAQGQLPDGRLVQQRTALFTRGTLVYQATMLGERLDAQAQQEFFGALRVGS